MTGEVFPRGRTAVLGSARDGGARPTGISLPLVPEWDGALTYDSLAPTEVASEHAAVIRYFKNLFTQAPALFFFLTDKAYFDVIDGKIASERRKRSDAVQHTFFTNRIFVSRPALNECLDFFAAVMPGDDARAAIEAIRGSRSARLRLLEEMSPVERFLRVLLLNSQNHLFDLKNEMRRYVASTSTVRSCTSTTNRSRNRSRHWPPSTSWSSRR